MLFFIYFAHIAFGSVSCSCFHAAHVQKRLHLPLVCVLVYVHVYYDVTVWVFFAVCSFRRGSSLIESLWALNQTSTRGPVMTA